MTARYEQIVRESAGLTAENVKLRCERDGLINRFTQSSLEGTNVSSGPHAFKMQRDDAFSGNIESRTKELDSWIKVGSEGSDDGMVSVLSGRDSEEHCFMSDAIFKKKSGDDTDTGFVSASKLEKGCIVVAADGNTPMMVSQMPKIYNTNRIVELRAGCAVLSVTRDHRFPMLDSVLSERREAKAIELRPGNLIFAQGRAVELEHVQEHILEHDVEVVKLVFTPDPPIAAFAEPMAIASHGSRKMPLRRGGKKKGNLVDSEVQIRTSVTTSSECDD